MKKGLIFIFIIIVFMLFIKSIPYINIFSTRNDEFQGIILYKYIDVPDHNTNVIKYKGKYGVRENSIEYEGLFDSAEKGDYIIKQKGSLKYILIKKNKDTLNFDK